MEIIVRAATTADRVDWVRMRHELWPDCPAERHALEIEQLSAPSAEGIVLLAVTNNGEACGFLEVSVRHDHVDGTKSVPVPYLEGWYVDPKFRGHGVGRELLKETELWALMHGYEELASDAELEKAESIQAHLSCGFHETCRAVHFVKRIGPDLSLPS